MTSSNESEKQITELQQENELLLLQLHQVQEELEHYFLLYRDCEAKNQELAAAPKALSPATTTHSIPHRAKNSPLFVERLPKNLARILKRTTFVRKSILRHSGFFDEAWYLKTYPDVAEKRRDPVAHYLRHGAKEGRNPGPQFDTQWYLSNNRDVGEKGVNPLWHYVQFGQHEGRLPRPGGIQPPPDSFDNERKWLTQARNEQARLAAERQRRIEQLTQANETAKKQAKEQQEFIERLTREREQFARQQDSLHGELQQVIEARDFQVLLAEERLQQIEQLIEIKTEAEQRVSELQDQIAALMQDKEEQSKLAMERLQQIEQLTVFKAGVEKQVCELQNQIATLIADTTKKQQQLNDCQNKLEVLSKEKGEHAKIAEDRLQRIKQLETQLVDMDTRQTMLNEEMVKAEAQIDLIKEMFFKE